VGYSPELSDVLTWPYPVLNVGNFLNAVVFMGKCYLLVFVQMWVRWTLPRLRIDQVMMTCLKYLLPIACFLLLGISVWEVFARPVVGEYVKYVLAAVVMVPMVGVMVRIVLTPSTLPSVGVASPWDTVPPRP
jgi:NADH-quinone oxidoreductase subunit H